MNNLKKIIIVGGGISGLYLGYKLADHYDVTILEKSDRLGGRIMTKSYAGINFEAGAGRFSRCHKILFKLLEDFGLTSKDKLIPIKKTFKYTGIYNKIEDHDTDINYYYNKVFNHLQMKDKLHLGTTELANMTTYDFLKSVLTPREFNNLISIYPFKGDIKYSSALCGLNILSCEYNSKQFFVLNGGLEQLVNSLEEQILSKGGIIKKVIEVTSCFSSNNGDSYILKDSNGLQYSCDKLILCIPPLALEKLNPNMKYFGFLKHLKHLPLLRIYFYYEEPQGVLEGLVKTVTDLDIHFILPMNPQMIMISYTDSELADMWYSLYNSDSEEFYKKILGEFREVLGVELEKPSKVFMEYWADGMYVWKKGYDYIQNADKISYPCKNLYISNEGFSDKQGWIEGSLRMANDILGEMETID
jgi:protoporphyrinogen oxidase